MPDQPLSSQTVRVGQVWEDTYISNAKAGRWLFRVMKLNEKSVRVEPCEDSGWNMLAGYEFQYRMENKHFSNGRCRLVRNTLVDDLSGEGVASEPRQEPQGCAKGSILATAAPSPDKQAGSR